LHGRGTVENLLVMPITPVEVMLGKIIPYVAGRLRPGRADYRPGDWNLRGPGVRQHLSACGAVDAVHHCNLSIGYTFSTIAQNQLQAMQMSMMFFLPNILLSGFMFPFAGMLAWARWIGEGLPLTHYLRIVRAIMLKGSGLADLRNDALVLTGLMLVAMAIAVIRFRRTLD
jgi:ABC-2 type transport system permease protein